MPQTNARRALLWGVLVLALAAVTGIALWKRIGRPQPPPVLSTVPDFALTNRDGRTVRRADLSGEPWIADFVFTRCASSCPMLSLKMQKLDRELPATAPVRFVSFSVDPDYDTPEVLARYARSFGASDRWLFLTGPRETLHSLSRNGFKLALEPAGGTAKEPILHSTRFVLVDGEGRIRGYYEAFDPASMERLRRDLQALQALSR